MSYAHPMSSRPAGERDRWKNRRLVTVADEIQLITALARGDNDALIGTPESEWLEFKSAPYGIPDPGRRWQLAKDVAGFANARGGHIVIGVKTAKHPNKVVEAAISWSAIEKGLVDAESYQSTIKSWVYPYVRGVKFTWFPPSSSEVRQPASSRQSGRVTALVRQATEVASTFGGQPVDGVETTEQALVPMFTAGCTRSL